jgi:long-chain acyl-CoA synthetase
MEKIWKKHWPSWVDERAIRLPEETLPAVLQRQARRVPDRAAIIFYGREVTFAELHDSVCRFAGWLQARGIRAGDRVAIFLENCPQFAIAYYGALRAGAIVVCLNPMHKAVELQHEFEDSGARILVTSDQLYPVVDPIRAQTPLEAVVVTAYRDFLPLEPTLPPPASFLDPAVHHPGTEPFLPIVRTAPRLAEPVQRSLSDTALRQTTSATPAPAGAAQITHPTLVA